MKATCSASLLVALLLAVGSRTLAEDKAEKPAAAKTSGAARVLFAKENFYRDQAGKEQAFEGVLSKKIRKGFGFGRFNPFRLQMKSGLREVYIGGQVKLLDAYAGKRVRIIGKPVRLEVEGNVHNEIWPASISLLSDQKLSNKKFSVIEVVQTGGFAGVNIQYRIQADGRFEMKSRRRSAKGKLNEKDIASLATAVNAADWAKVPKTLKTKNTADDFEYTMHVKIGSKTHRIVCDGISATKRSPLREIVLTLVKIQRTPVKK